MEGLEGGPFAELAVIGQPNVAAGCAGRRKRHDPGNEPGS
jgi:hypothetical protein